jgi:hypothetical protein
MATTETKIQILKTGSTALETELLGSYEKWKRSGILLHEDPRTRARRGRHATVLSRLATDGAPDDPHAGIPGTD